MVLLIGQAHPPIHPTKHTAGESNWPPEKTRLYEFIVRSFLATCSKPAVGFETRLEICVAGEGFSTTGQLLTQLFKAAYTDIDSMSSRLVLPAVNPRVSTLYKCVIEDIHITCRLASKDWATTATCAAQ
jgi:DNA topoisomerase IA